MIRADDSHHGHRTMLAHAAIAVLALSAAAFSQNARAAIIAVNTTSDVVAVDGSCSLREAITSVNRQAASGNLTGECAAGDGNDDTLVVPAGTYTLTIAGMGEDNNASGDLDLRASVAIQGAGIGQTIIDANGVDRAFELAVASITVRMSDLSIVNGNLGTAAAGAGASGGGINTVLGADLVLTRVELAYNTAGSAAGSSFAPASDGGNGGAVNSTGGTLTLIECSFHDNVAGRGGALQGGGFGVPGRGGLGGAINSIGTSLGMADSTFSRNRSGDPGGTLGVVGFGGAIYASGGDLSILRSAFDANQAGSSTFSYAGGGGALRLDQVSTQIVQTSITRNIARLGAGLETLDSTVTLRNVTISGNMLVSPDAALALGGGTGQLDFVTISSNSSTAGGLAGLIVSSGVFGDATVSVRNSIISGNAPPTSAECVAVGSNVLRSEGHNVMGAGCPVDGPSDTMTATPLLGPLGDNGGIGLTQVPQPGSPATDQGSCFASGIAEDARGHLRFVDIPRIPNAIDACDVGAVELDDDIFWDGYE